MATTGFGRYGVGFRDIQVTEITSGARGAHYLFPSSRCVLDIGGQSTRAMTVGESGKVRDLQDQRQVRCRFWDVHCARGEVSGDFD